MTVVIMEDSKHKMVVSAALLFRERGLAGTSFRDVVAHSGAPRGSIYHHFPGGKTELAEEAVDWAGTVIADWMRREGGDPVAMLRSFVLAWRRVLDDEEFRAGCPLVAVATGTDDERLMEAASLAFARCVEGFADSLRRAGVEEARAASLATLVVSAVEGAIVLCRARRDAGALEQVGSELESTIAAAL
jgi:AcrR family transcriptional regulator